MHKIVDNILEKHVVELLKSFAFIMYIHVHI